MRRLGWLLLLPALLWRPGQPAVGDWRLTVLDTGQSGAAVLQTHTHAFLFDTGKRTSPDVESGSRTIVPFLRSQGIRQLDALIVSHADLDHVGGASGVLRAIPVRQAFSAFDLPAWLRREARQLGTPDDMAPLPQESHTCAAGQHWEVDGVAFTFLWPRPDADADSAVWKSNANSCVLLVRGAHHAVLFTGDIGAAQERALLANMADGVDGVDAVREVNGLVGLYTSQSASLVLADGSHQNSLSLRGKASPNGGGLAPATRSGGFTAVDIVLAPHHGSRFSSSDAFVAATRPAHVIAQAGLWNPFGHPHPQTVHRWQRAGAWFWRTDLDGAVQVQSAQGTLTVHATREHWPRYWQLPCYVRQTCDVE